MNEGRTIFAQLLDHASRDALDRCIRRYNGNRRVRTFSCRDRFLVMAFAQITYRESLRDIEACLSPNSGSPSRSTCLSQSPEERLGSESDLYTLLQILSVSLLEKTALSLAFASLDHRTDSTPSPNQLQLLDL